MIPVGVTIIFVVFPKKDVDAVEDVTDVDKFVKLRWFLLIVLYLFAIASFMF